MMGKKETQEALIDCGKSGCLRILAASALEDQLGAPRNATITLKRAEALGLYAMANAFLQSTGDEFISQLTPDEAFAMVRAAELGRPLPEPTIEEAGA